MPAFAYLSVIHPEAALDFYGRAFGGEVVNRTASRSGEVVYAEVVFEEDARVLIGIAGDHPLRPAPMHGQGAVYLYTADLDGLVARAVFAGARLVRPAAEESWGDRVAVLEDPDGNRWFWAEHLARDGRKIR